MQYPFTYDLKIGDAAYAQVEGSATIEPCDYEDWIITGLTVSTFAGDADLPKPHPLYAEIHGYLMAEKEADIAWDWNEHVFECRAERMELA